MSPLAHGLLNVIGVLLVALSIAAGLIWVERRLLALWQDRYGPNRVGPFGLLQVVADAIKLLTKEDWIPPFADRPVFVMAPAVIVVTVLLAFAVVPVTPGIGVISLNVGLLFFLAMSSLGVYSVVLGGWASDSKYALLGGLRAAAQMLSYEVFMGLSLMGVVLIAGSFDLRTIVQAQHRVWFCIPQCVGLAIFLVAGIAETRRLPFDLPEAESELVAGFFTEYSGMRFAFFFIAEYANMVLVSCVAAAMFLGGWNAPYPGTILAHLGLEGIAWVENIAWFTVKVYTFLFLFFWLRATLPRLRYDQLMKFGWKVMLPIALGNIVVTSIAAYLFPRG